MKNIKTYLFFITLILLGGLIVGLLTNNNTDTILMSSLTPPKIVFPIVWTILYILMGITLTRIYLAKNNTLSIILFSIQLFLNYVWSFLFFNLEAYKLSFIWMKALWIFILAMIFTTFKIDKKASLLH